MKNQLLKKLLVFIFITLIGLSVNAQTIRTEGNIIYIPLPAEYQENSKVIQTYKAQLIDYALQEIKKIYQDTINGSLIVVFTDGNGKPIMSDAKAQGALLSRDANEISFTFNSPSYPWSAQNLADMSDYVRDIYPVIKEVMGHPMFNNTVNISRDPTSTASGTYFSDLNEIVLASLHADVFCHEVIHAFRDDFILGFSNYEEGITRATEIAVMNKLLQYESGFRFHNYNYDVYYESLNTPEIRPRYGNVYNPQSFALLRYQLAGYAWSKLYLEDSTFYLRFNDSVFAKAQVDISVIYTEAALKNIVFSIAKSCEGIEIKDWYSRQNILNINPSTGYKLFQRPYDFVYYYFQRTEVGEELIIGGEKLFYEIYRYDNTLISKGDGITTSFGWVQGHPKTSVNDGRIKSIVYTQSPSGMISDTAYAAFGGGLFGIVEEADTGLVITTPLDTLMESYTMKLHNGRFEIPQLETVQGRIKVEFYYAGCKKFSRIYTKDRSRYFVNINKRDSFFITDVVAQPVITTSDNFLCVKDPDDDYSYKWLLNGNVYGDDESCIFPNESGVYKVEITSRKNQCACISPDFNYIITSTDKVEQDKISIYPNPGNGIFNITLTHDTDKAERLSLYDVNGRLVYSKEDLSDDDIKLDLSKFSKGIYYLNVTSGKHFKSELLINQ